MYTYYLITNHLDTDASISDAIEADQINVEQDELSASKKITDNVAINTMNSNYYTQFFCLS